MSRVFRPVLARGRPSLAAADGDGVAEGTGERVLRAARERFLRDGYDATTIRAIAADARVATGTVLLHHGSKQQLASTVLAEALRGVAADADARLDPDAPPLDRVTAAVAAIHLWYADRVGIAAGLLQASVLSPSHTAVEARTVLLFARVLEEDRTAGRLPDDTDVRTIAEGLTADHTHVLLQALRGDWPPLDQQLARFRRLAATRLPA